MQASKLVADWSMHWSRDMFLIKLQLYSIAKLQKLQLSENCSTAIMAAMVAIAAMRASWTKFLVTGHLIKKEDSRPSPTRTLPKKQIKHLQHSMFFFDGLSKATQDLIVNMS